jgi:hypothetical protein
MLHTSTPFSVLIYWLENMFSVQPLSDDSGVVVLDIVTILKEDHGVRIEWNSTPESDVVADSVMALFVGADGRRASVKCLFIQTKSILTG